jgi:hypothetical protein
MEAEWRHSRNNSQRRELVTERLLSVNADFTIDVKDERVHVRGDGSNIVVEVPSILLGFQMMRDLGAIKPVRERVSKISQWLTQLGLTVTVRTPGRKLLTMGSEGNSWLLRLFGFSNAKLHLS